MKGVHNLYQRIISSGLTISSCIHARDYGRAKRGQNERMTSFTDVCQPKEWNIKESASTDKLSHLFRTTRVPSGGSRPCSNIAAAISSMILAGCSFVKAFTMQHHGISFHQHLVQTSGPPPTWSRHDGRCKTETIHYHLWNYTHKLLSTRTTYEWVNACFVAVDDYVSRQIRGSEKGWIAFTFWHRQCYHTAAFTKQTLPAYNAPQLQCWTSCSEDCKVRKRETWA